ncbi:MAG TPA: SAM-dependent chlorinase/fluorinase [Ktedonobacterales bacterium]|nr:SAM-dependent chlorinase/fluorinase [Ktedonobacterales bacterium]
MVTGKARAPLVALLTDFGTADGYVGVMKAVILGITPDLPLVDLTHAIPPQDVRAGAWVLHTVWQDLPPDSICLGVVDPGVGTERRAVAAAVSGRYFVGPDNGLLGYVLAATPATAAVLLDNPRFARPNPSAPFHRRDLFAPAAGHLAAGLDLTHLGTPLAPETLITRALPQPEPHADGWLGHVLHVDHFGTLITDFGPSVAPALLRQPQLRLRVGGTEIHAQAATFAAGPPDTPFALLDSSGHLAIAIRNGSAAAWLHVGRDAEVLAVGAQRPPV